MRVCERCSALAIAVLFICAGTPAPAVAQGEQDEWAASSAGHLAFINRDDGISVLRVLDPEGRQAPPEVVTTTTSEPIVAMGARGDAIVVWYDNDEMLWARYRPAGGPLGPPEPVADKPVDFGPEAVDVGLDASGNSTVVWPPAQSRRGAELLVRARTEAGVWSAPQAFGALYVFDADLAISDNGGALLAWRQARDARRPNASQLAVTARPPGGAFGPPRVLAGVQRAADEPRAALNDRGDAVIGWVEQHRPPGKPRAASEFSVHAAFRAPSRGFAPPVRLNRTRDMAGHRFAVLNDGTMVFGWTDNFTREAEVRVRTADGRIGPAKTVTDDLEVNSDLFPLRVGHGAIAWADRDPDVSTIRLARATPDGRWLPTQDIGRARGWHLGPAFAISAAGLIAVPRRPLTPTDRIPWMHVPG
jgi:hypothetical protein